MKPATMSLSDLATYCTKLGDDAEAVQKFIAWLKHNRHIWEAFEKIAYEQMERGLQANGMWVINEVRRRDKIPIINAAQPGLCRVFNCKYERKYFKVQRMMSFNEVWAERRAA